MAVTRSGGRRAVTRLKATETFGPDVKPVAALIRCRLETGRTHQIRVHCAYCGHALAGDPVYGRGRHSPAGALSEAARAALDGFPRQALHAATLGFVHPVGGEALRFESPLPEDMAGLIETLRAG